MGWVFLTQRLNILTLEQSYWSGVMAKIADKKRELHSYAAAIADGKICCKEFAGLANWVKPMAMEYACGSQPAAFQNAYNETTNLTFPTWCNQQNQRLMQQNAMMQQTGQQQVSPAQQQQMAMIERANAYQAIMKQAQKAQLEEMKKVETEKIKVLEDELDQQNIVAKTRYDAASSEAKDMRQAIKQDQEQNAPKYA